MDFPHDIRIATIPRGLKIVFFAATSAILIFNIYIIYFGFKEKDYGVWIAAGGYLLGVVLPTLMVLLLVQFSHTGVRALRDRTASLLCDLLPQQLRLVAECVDTTKSSIMRRAPRPKRTLSMVHVEFDKGECWADYVVQVPQIVDGQRLTKEMLLRIEVNVRRANIDVFLSRSLLEGNAAIASPPRVTKAYSMAKIQQLFPHTLGGAKRAGYDHNEEPIRRTVSKEDYDCVVLIREFSTDFLWDSAEMLWFAQDLMFMIRSFLLEHPELFKTVVTPS